ncbi:ParA/MinD ATPase like-domain-containing protein [Rhodocollybia butyracea]|uniref:ParA/MinD ATPase like-domain-containing protein n=1 Tax=Rhodocollybia butyracea TaxID=206335 RepID=A0A9P5PK30_9AGAR|nr:ParA/MinD ATPase like-domain-containing protein [Rhodocollybia butyracea]
MLQNIVFLSTACANFQETCASNKYTQRPDPSLPFIKQSMSTVKPSEQVHSSSTGWSPVYVQDNLAVMFRRIHASSARDTVMWRGPKKNGLISQFLKDMDWGDLDYLVVDIDTPPGTSDEHLSIVQFLKESGIHGAVLITISQEGALQDVGIRILGIVERMSGFVCPSCNTESQIFKPGTGGAKRLAEETGIELLGAVSLDPRIGKSADYYPDSPATTAYLDIIDRIKAILGDN